MKSWFFVVSLFFVVPSFADEKADYTDMLSCARSVAGANKGQENTACELVRPDDDADYLLTMYADAQRDSTGSFYVYSSKGIYRVPLPKLPPRNSRFIYQMNLPNGVDGRGRKLCVEYSYSGALFADHYKKTWTVAASASCGSNVQSLGDLSEMAADAGQEKGRPNTNQPLYAMGRKMQRCLSHFRGDMERSAERNPENLGFYQDKWKKIASNREACEAAEPYFNGTTDAFRKAEKANNQIQEKLKDEADAKAKANREQGTTDSPGGANSSGSSSPDQGGSVTDTSLLKNVANKEEKPVLSEDGCIRHGDDLQAMQSRLPQSVRNLPVYYSMENYLGNKAAIQLSLVDNKLKLSSTRSDGDTITENAIIDRICTNKRKPGELTIFIGTSGEPKTINVEDNGEMNMPYSSFITLPFKSGEAGYKKVMSQMSAKNEGTATQKGTK